MSRMFEDGSSSLAEKARTRVIRCPHCSIELNLPDAALGRRLKCPKCELKFQAPSAEELNQVSASGPASSMFLPTRGVGSSGSVELPSFGTGSSSGSVELPTSLAPLRETFELPLLSEDLPRRPAGRQPASASPADDAMALFQDEPKTTRKPKGAEARAQARRCTSCSTVVPAGMSLCSRCGLDLDTGQRHTPIDLFEEEVPAAEHNPLPPVTILVIGSLCSIGFLLLAMISVANWFKGVAGAPLLLVLWLFGLYGGAQFLRQKSIRTMFIGLSLAVSVGAIYLIALPIYRANVPALEGDESGLSAPEGVVAETLLIKPLEDRLDLNRIYFGIGSLLSYAAVALYLNSPTLRRQFYHHQPHRR